MSNEIYLEDEDLYYKKLLKVIIKNLKVVIKKSCNKHLKKHNKES